MHSLYFVKIQKAHDAYDAKTQAVALLDANSFTGEGGFFSSSKADWYVVGGRWSGHLQSIQLKKSFYDEVGKLLNKTEKYFGFSTKEIEDNKQAIQNLWLSLGGKDENPFSRDNYKSHGYDDDAMKIDNNLLLALKKNKDVEVFCEAEYDEKKVDDLSKDDIGQWLVVIDYHC